MLDSALRTSGSWLAELSFELFLVWFAVSEADLLVEVSFVALFLQKVFLVLSVRFLRRCVFQVVSVTNALKLRLI
ncbi:hypothetical protein BBM42_02540 [Vibrio parahaemolyticus]|nr:hypothetical protein AKH04_22655 [Vibrio parahaemolyticus]ODZ54680.1 hypothetical protein BBM41_01600 [Vibrio parahaemolyticus]ODZ68553.1 hypothetical protein BBM42_02540 [Vibrio parahaemolyticus]TOQ02625.1 hypothetical protein CGH04_23520 [Vibrio parahaemolyticus]